MLENCVTKQPFTNAQGTAWSSACRTIAGWLPLLFATLGTPPMSIQACDDMTVRDAAFQEARDLHRLCVIASPESPELGRIHQRLGAWLTSAGKDLNLELTTIDVDSPEVKWESFGVPGRPPSSPVVMLSGFQRAHGRGFFIDHWDPEPTEADLETLASSPTRKRLRELLPTKIAVLVYAPAAMSTTGAEVAAERQRIDDVLAGSVKRWSEHALGLAVLRLDRSDPRERTLASFCGLAPDGPAWVGVVFGRGKFAEPPLAATEITRAAIDELIETILAKCTCLSQAAKLGVDLPMVWREADDKRVLPTIKAGAVAEGSTDATDASATPDLIAAMFPKGAPAAPTASLVDVTEPAPRQRGGFFAAALWLLGAGALALFVGTIVIVRRRTVAS